MIGTCRLTLQDLEKIVEYYEGNGYSKTRTLGVAVTLRAEDKPAQVGILLEDFEKIIEEVL